MSEVMFWAVIAGLTGLLMMVGDSGRERDRQRIRREAFERQRRFLNSPEDREEMRRVCEIVRRCQERRR